MRHFLNEQDHTLAHDSMELALKSGNTIKFEPLCSVISHIKQEINKLVNILRGPPHSKGTVVSISFRVPC